MKRFLFFAFFLFGFNAVARAEIDYYDVSCDSFTSAYSTSTSVTVSSYAYALDMIQVTNPGSSSFVEVWDWRGSTGTGKYLGYFDTTAKFNYQFGIYGVKLSTDITFHNQGDTPAGIKFYWRPTQQGVCRPVY